MGNSSLPTYIDNQESLAQLVDFTRASVPSGGQPRVALDLEADSAHSYKEKLCLLQFHVAGENTIIDPFEIDDFDDFLKMLEESELWLHGSDYDLALMRMRWDWLPPVLHDTQIAAQLVGRTKFGLASLLQDTFDVTLSKESQREDWAQRPLPEKMISYALNDVRHLLALADILVAELNRLGRYTWFEQSCAHLKQTALNRQEKDPDDLWRIKGWGRLSPRGWGYLRELWRWRDEGAAARDKPAFKFMPSGKMLYLAGKLEKEGRGFLTGKYTPEEKNSFRDAIKRASKLEDSELPRRRRTGRRERVPDLDEKVAPLRAYRDRLATDLAIDPVLIMTRSQMEDIALRPEETLAALLPWQQDLMRDATSD